ncbi:MAG: hypothetical protein II776_00185, partial [Clostridia bacterium]|nr:hypothetical protein [Clostridia bacterium]
MEKKLTAGFASVDITPERGGIALAGYGSTHLRLAARILDPLSALAVAIGNENGPQCVMLTMDLINATDNVLRPVRAAVHEATGLPEDRIYVGGTHTHSGPDLYSPLDNNKRFREEELPPKAAEAARRAVADLKPATVLHGVTEVGHPGARLNFNRHYYMVEKSKLDDYTEADLHPVGDNYGLEYSGDPEHYAYVAHEEEADHSMQIVRLVREAADDVVLVNFGVHAHVTGGSKRYDLSADFPAPFRARLEKLLPGTRVVFLNGCAGNVNPNTRIASEGLRGVTSGVDRDHRAYASALAGYAQELLAELNGKRMIPSETDKVGFARRVITAPRDHSMDQLAEAARDISELFKKEGNSDAVRKLCLERGFNSPYHANAALSKVK